MNAPETLDIVDVQRTPDLRQIPINKVGIKDIQYPIRVKERDGGDQHTIAKFSMYVNLPQDFKGTHMSRFVEILNEHEGEISVPTFQAMLPRVTELLEAQAGHIEMSFTYFMRKRAPVSGVASLMDYQVAFMGDLVGEEGAITVRVTVPVTSLCPCSKQISAYGAHNQRSHVTVTARINGFLWLEELIETIEAQASCELYGLLKRPDEKYVTERAYENPKFVEDLVRDLAHALRQDQRIDSFTVEAENFESIHNHSAYALIQHDGGKHD